MKNLLTQLTITSAFGIKMTKTSEGKNMSYAVGDHFDQFIREQVMVSQAEPERSSDLQIW